MNKSSDNKHGIRLQVKKCREQFRISENLDHYSDKEYKEAERRYVKFCLTGKPK